MTPRTVWIELSEEDAKAIVRWLYPNSDPTKKRISVAIVRALARCPACTVPSVGTLTGICTVCEGTGRRKGS